MGIFFGLIASFAYRIVANRTAASYALLHHKIKERKLKCNLPTPKRLRPMIKKICLVCFSIFLSIGLIEADPIYLGIDVLEQSGFRAIGGKRIGLLTHPAGLNRRGESSIDVLRRAKNFASSPYSDRNMESMATKRLTSLSMIRSTHALASPFTHSTVNIVSPLPRCLWDSMPW